MNTVDLIRKKRDGYALEKDEINFLVSGYSKDKIPDYQFSAFLMAAYLIGITKEETSYLTNAMLHSGKVLDLSSIPGVKVDKHSTGGVGDKTSLIIAPIVAAAGVKVPMISGRGLGHTGGTLDKLESIPGFRTDLSINEYKKVLKNCGAVLIGQTKDIAPADKLIYSLRDVTATVESIPLITASIMSKKLAEGIDGLVLDIKTGNGAFMKEEKDAIVLADSLVLTAKAFNKKVIAFITDMNQPLGNYIGNWLEVYEAIEILKGEKKNDLYNLSIKLAGTMIFLGGKALTIKEGEQIAKEQITKGYAFERFVEIVKAQKGDIKYLYNPGKYRKPKFKRVIKSVEDSFLNSVNTFEMGLAAVELGAGRLKKDDLVDPAAGIKFNFKIGDKINKGDIIAELYSDNKNKILLVEKRFNNMVGLSGRKVNPPRLIKKIIKQGE
ncbi:MAG: thymidine phosphorylase [Ignavibacteria bacterium GWA2_35_9]|nr:MAG: thymidine phosphorylase [Ignavibacteria bacterium GWA2_35_9]OGU46306.1 MAG: thymidine phosphorylase [Ignavibacteria bacterium GWB2_36_8]OGU51570.1 MAG: thymidine phosphorylase [Ignavibacteria bacterium GWC2_36_12]OGV05727.1 MAG: thymidine phosphorylase [Ignavibacteria bacterium RIFOXYB2_FULL_36_7]